MSSVRVDVHGYEGRLRRALVLARSDLSSRDMGLVEGFVEACLAEEVSKARCSRYVLGLRRIRGILGKGLEEADRRDMQRVVAVLCEMGYRPWTLQYYKVTLKRFYRWLRGCEEDPPETAWIKTSLKNNAVVMPEEILSQEEVGRIVASAENLRDKAFIEVLYESGLRVGEFLVLRLRHVEFDRYGAVLNVRGKTGSRRVRVVESAPRLQTWIENHPHRESDGWLWVNIGNINKGRRLEYHAARKMLRAAATRAGVAKRVNVGF